MTRRGSSHAERCGRRSVMLAGVLSLGWWTGASATPGPSDGGVESAAVAPFPNHESGLVRPLAFTGDGRFLCAVNPPDHRLEIFRLDESGVPVFEDALMTGLEPVAVQRGAPGQVLVVNRLSDSIAVVDVEHRRVVRLVPVGREPLDVVVTHGAWFVACAGARDRQGRFTPHVVQVVDGESGELRRSVPVGVLRPRALAVHGDVVYVLPLHSGNRTRVLPPTSGASPDPEEAADTFFVNEALWSPRLLERGQPGHAPPATARIVSDLDADLAPQDRDLVALDATRGDLLEPATRGIGSSLFQVCPVGDRLWVSALRARNDVRFERELWGRAFDNVLVEVDAEPGGEIRRVVPLRGDRGEFAGPGALAVGGADEPLLYVAALFSSAVLAIDPARGAIRATLRTGPLPSGLAVSPSGERLHVYVREDLSLETFDLTTSPPRRLARTPLSYNPEPDLVRLGRRHLYDARSGDHGSGNFACASCHLFGETDLLAWDLGDPGGGLGRYAAGPQAGEPFHPMKGPMITQTLVGLAEGPFHWRADRRDLQGFHASFRTLLGGDGIDRPAMQELAGFLTTLQAPDPVRPAAAVAATLDRRGAQGHSCRSCHESRDTRGPLGRLHDGQRGLAPDLRGLAARAAAGRASSGFGHAGAIADPSDLEALHAGFGDGVLPDLEPDERAALVAALFDPPPRGAGRQYWLDAAGAPGLATWLKSARQDGCEVLLKASWSEEGPGARPRGALLLDDGVQWATDQGGVLSMSALIEAARRGAVHGFAMAVPRGMARRLGIDRDEDFRPDGLEHELGSDPVDPDSDDDGRLDGADPAREVRAPCLVEHRVLALSASAATLELVFDQPATLALTLSTAPEADSLEPRRVTVNRLRSRHAVPLDGLAADRLWTVRVSVHDATGRPSDAATLEFRTARRSLHVQRIDLESRDGPLEAVVFLVDQGGRPASDCIVQGLWHRREADGHITAASQWDQWATQPCDGSGRARFALPPHEGPPGTRFTFTVTDVRAGPGARPLVYDPADNLASFAVHVVGAASH